jgi:hypothetical protein
LKKINYFLLILVLCSCNTNVSNKKDSLKAPIISPFSGIDTISTNDWWNRLPNPIINVDVKREDVLAFGMYTVSNNILKLTAQLFPLYPYETREVRLEVYENKNWKEIQKKKVNDLGWATTFRVENWNSSINTKYRLLHGDKASFQGLIRKDPINKNEIILAAFSCNSNKDRGDRNNYVNNINH